MWKNIISSLKFESLRLIDTNFFSLNLLSKRGIRSLNQNQFPEDKTSKDLVISKQSSGNFEKKKKIQINENVIKIGTPGSKFRSFKLPLEKRDNYEKKFVYGGRSDRIPDELDNQEPESFLKNEDLDLYAMNEELYHRKVVDEDMKKRRRIKFAIINKKIRQLEGRQEPDFNLLTWDAKEQIKHIHLKEPEIWTPERIAESFPITVESCKKLLRSSWSPRTLNELAWHDQKVIENWKILSEIEKNPNQGGPAVNIYQEYKKMNKLNLLKHATGLPGIDFQRSSQIFSDSYAIHQSLFCKPGAFSKIVKYQDTEKIRGYFVKDSQDQQEIMKQVKKLQNVKKETDALKEHLSMTKLELSKSLAKILSNNDDKAITKNQKKSKS